MLASEQGHRLYKEFQWFQDFTSDDLLENMQLLQGFQDFAGSAVVHMSGGCLALVATVIMGARKNRSVTSKDEANSKI